jgi:NaMN:DMB phosphoribosyltransferase
MSAADRPANGARRFGTAATKTAANPSSARTVETAFSPLLHLDRRVAEQLHDYTVEHPTVAAAMPWSATLGNPWCGGWC